MEDSVTEGEGMLPQVNLKAEDESHEEKECGFLSKKQKIEEEGEGEGKGGGGLINSLISTMVSPVSQKTEDESGNGDLKKKKEEEENGEGGGIISNMISNLFHKSDESEKDEVEEDEKKMEGDDDDEQEKTEEGDDHGGGKGIIGNLVSHMPASFHVQDDAVPTADEATILINSLVRD